MPDTNDLHTGTWVTYVGGRATSVRVRRCRLEVTAGPDSGLVRDIDVAAISIGARRGNHVQLSDSKVSGLHCEIRIEEAGYRLCDLGSTNGTYVAGMRVNDAFIPPNAHILVGDSKLKFDPLDESVELPLSMRDRFGSMIGRSVKMRELFARLGKLAKSDATVLIAGETGVGKELVAESLHEYSDRSSGPFEVVDCGAIPQNLMESQLFGHERGAFTGAVSAHAGVFERANRGTVFLDEIGELPLDMQSRLLRVLERREIQRVMGTKTIPVDIRVVAATHRDLGMEVNRGRFREDLYYRLAVARVHVPPLRSRLEDIPLLVDHILAQTPGGESAYLAPETIERLMRHDWPGNVRELRNVIEQAVVLSETSVDQTELEPRSSSVHSTRSPASLSVSRVPDARPPKPPATADDAPGVDGEHAFVVDIDISKPFKVAKQGVITQFERRFVTQLLREHGGNISQAARAAGLDRMSLHKIIKRLQLNPKKE